MCSLLALANESPVRWTLALLRAAYGQIAHAVGGGFPAVCLHLAPFHTSAGPFTAALLCTTFVVSIHHAILCVLSTEHPHITFLHAENRPLSVYALGETHIGKVHRAFLGVSCRKH